MKDVVAAIEASKAKVEEMEAALAEKPHTEIEITIEKDSDAAPELKSCPVCGTATNSKFCPECGKPRPAADGWTCSCGAVNKGKFCAECGAKKPAGVPQYKCDKCGWEPDNPAHPPKFCPECGDPFDDGDVQG